MAEFEEGLMDLLEADAGVTAIVGAGAVARIFPRKLKSGATMPAITYSLVSAPLAALTLDDASRQRKTRYQFDCWTDLAAGGYLRAAQLCSAIIGVLEGYRGTLTSGHRVDETRVVNFLDLYDPESERDRRIVDAVFTYEETL